MSRFAATAVVLAAVFALVWWQASLFAAMVSVAVAAAVSGAFGLAAGRD